MGVVGTLVWVVYTIDMDAWGESRRLEQELAEVLTALGELRDQMAEVPAGLIGHFRRRRIARQTAELERRLIDLRARWAELPPD